VLLGETEEVFGKEPVQPTILTKIPGGKAWFKPRPLKSEASNQPMSHTWPLTKQWTLIASEFIVNAGFEHLTDRPETGSQNMLD
jgi:hypothetical protein